MARDALSPAQVRDLRRQTEARRLELIRTDLDLCRTLTGIVESELAVNNHEHAAQTLARASKGYADLRRMFEQRRHWEEQATAEISEKLSELRQTLDRLNPLVQRQ